MLALPCRAAVPTKLQTPGRSRAGLNTVHSHISKALEDCQVSDDEYKLIFLLDEVENYRAAKAELRHKICKRCWKRD